MESNFQPKVEIVFGEGILFPGDTGSCFQITKDENISIMLRGGYFDGYSYPPLWHNPRAWFRLFRTVYRMARKSAVIMQDRHSTGIKVIDSPKEEKL